MTNNIPTGVKEHRESIEQESRQTAKIFFRRASSNLREPECYQTAKMFNFLVL